MGCKTLAKLDFMRVLLPAARITAAKSAKGKAILLSFSEKIVKYNNIILIVLLTR